MPRQAMPLVLKPDELDEETEQRDLIRKCKRNEDRYPLLSRLFHVPNGGWRNLTVGAKLKAAGVRPGVPDLCLPSARGGWFGLYVEMKRADGGRVSPEQADWHRFLRAEGYCVRVCHGCEAAWSVLQWYVELPATCACTDDPLGPGCEGTV